MLHNLKPSAWVLILVMICTCSASIAWQTKNAGAKQSLIAQDTTPKTEKLNDNETVIDGNLENAMEQVRKAQENLQRQLQNKDWDKWHRQLEQSLEKLNTGEIQQQLEKALKNIDLQKIQAETQEAMQKVNTEKMQEAMERAQYELKENINAGKIDMHIEKAMEETKRAMEKLKKVDMQKMQQQLERTRQELKIKEGSMQQEIERAKKEISKNLNKDFKKELEKAQEGVTRAQEELEGYKNMVDEMTKDGLLKSNKEYEIEYKKGELFVNGTKQTDEITNKYKHYFKKDNIKIRRDNEENKTIRL